MVILRRNRFLNADQIVGNPENETYSRGNGGIVSLKKENFPRVNIFEEMDRWVYTYEIPGVDPNNIKINIRNNMMTVKGNRSSFYQGKSSRIHCRESCVGACDFSRTLHLPGDADPECLHAHVQHGMLFVTVGKTENSHEETIEIEIEQNG